MNISIQKTKQIKEVILSDCKPSLEQFIAVVRYGAKLSFSLDMKQTIDQNRQLLEKFLAEERIIYGVTTGFGENVNQIIATDDAQQLQKNIVRSHACAMGEPLTKEQARAVMLMTILNAGKGHSGIRYQTLDLIRNLLNHDLYPYAPSEGSVAYLGVEGHLAMTYMGEGQIYQDGKALPAAQVLAAYNLEPIVYQCKEGLSILNGSITVTALGLIALYDSIITVKNLEIGGALYYEAMRATTKALDPRIHNNKQHSEQREAAINLLRMLEGSEIAANHRDDKVQDAYSLRSLAQITGAVKRLIKEAYQVMLDEMHSVSDNPQIFGEDNNDGVALMCGNFDGTYVGSHADMLAMAHAIMGTLAERATDRMVNHKLSDGLPPFLVKNPGLNNGLMILQYTAAGLVGEIKVLAHPSTIDNISTCANQEDPVSLAYYACKKAGQTAKKLQYIAAIEIFTALQAIDFLAPEKQSPGLAKVHDLIRQKVPFVDQDRFYGHDLDYLLQLINDESIINWLEDEIGELVF